MAAFHEADFRQVEQVRVDALRERLEQAQAQLQQRLNSGELGGADRFSDGQLRQEFHNEIERLGRWLNGDRSILLGRVVDDDGKEHFIGRRETFIDPNSDEVLIVDNRRENAFSVGFFRASPEDPMGLSYIVRYRWADDDPWALHSCSVLELSPLRDAERTEAEASPVTGERSGPDRVTRDGALRDVLAEFLADQDEIVRESLPGVLIVQGGPGTGKTVVGVERASWAELESNHGRVLFVAPTRTFFEYTRPLISALGANAVDQMLLRDFGASDLRVAISESQSVARVKGSERMSALLLRAVASRVRAAEVTLPVPGAAESVTLSEAEVADLITQVEALDRRHNDGAQEFRRRLVDLAAERSAELDLASVITFRQEVDRNALGRVVGRIWPRLNPETFLDRLLRDEAALEQAANGQFEAAELKLLHKTGDSESVAWSEHDVPLIDELRVLLEGETDLRYDHIVVDEAQDLTPMQVRMLARRARRQSMTLLGDVAQSTGPIVANHWRDVLDGLPAGTREDARVCELRRGFRVPRQFMELATRALDHIDPQRLLPRVDVVADGESAPVIRTVSQQDLVDVLIEEAQSQVGEYGRVAIIGSDSRLAQLEVSLRDRQVRFVGRGVDGADGIILRTAHDVKGLEFDAAIVVEPREIARDRARGARLLYVSLTRAAERLTIISSKGLPPELGGEPLSLATPESFDYGGSAPTEPVDVDRYGDRLADALALARRLYADRARRKSQEPHLPHALEVGALVMADGADEDEVVAALLHDVLEHPDWPIHAVEIERAFGRDAVEVVVACSWRAQAPGEPWSEWKAEYVEALRSYYGEHRSLVYRIVVAEKLVNARDFLDDADLAAGEMWARVTDDPSQIVEYYRALSDLLRGETSEPLSREFDRVVTELERVAAVYAEAGSFGHAEVTNS